MEITLKPKKLPTTWQRWRGKTVIVLDSQRKPIIGHVTGFNKYGWVMVQALNECSTHFSSPLLVIEYSYSVYKSLSRIYAYKNAQERLLNSKSQLRLKTT